MRATLLVTIYALLLYLPGLGTRTLTQHEVFAAQPAKEMVKPTTPPGLREQRRLPNPWIVPNFAGLPRTAKPATTSWAIALCMIVFQSEDEWVARLPPVLGSLATALMICSFTARRFGQRAGLVAGLMQLTCFYALMQGRLAEADMLVCAAVTAAMLSFANGILPAGQPRPRFWSTCFYIAAGAAFLLKVVPLLFIVLSIGTFALIRRDRNVGRFLWNPAGILILLVCIVSWPAAAYIAYPPIRKSWGLELFGTFTGRLGRDPIYTYLHTIPTVLLPWTPIMTLSAILPVLIEFRQLLAGPSWADRIVQAIRAAFAGRPFRQFLLCWFLPPILFLHISAQKHKHYPIPMLPPLSIVGGVGLLGYIAFQHRNPKAHRLFSSILWAGGCAGFAMAAFIVHDTQPLAWRILPILAVLAAGGLAFIYAEHRRRLNAQLIALFATTLLAPILVHTTLMPVVDDYADSANLARKSNAIAPPNQTIWIIDPQTSVEPQIAYYLRSPIARYRTAAAFAADPPSASGSMYVICDVTDARRLTERWRVEFLAKASEIHRRGGEDDRVMFVRLSPLKPRP
jgi:4-amino-4-deoxy-L-arabinose transferase-like glycosyltransferase